MSATPYSTGTCAPFSRSYRVFAEDSAIQLVEEVFQEDDVVLSLLRSRGLGGGHQRDDPAVQHDNVARTIDAQHSLIVRPVRARDYWRTDARQNVGGTPQRQMGRVEYRLN